MQIPKDIAEKLRKLVDAQESVSCLKEELGQWFNENTGADAVYISDYFITDNPKGKPNGEDEYCCQTCHYEDYYTGTYYHRIEGTNLWGGYFYET